MPLSVVMNKGKMPGPQLVSSASLQKISGHPLAVGYTKPTLTIDFSQLNIPERTGPNGKEVFFAGGTMTIVLKQKVYLSNSLSACEQRKWIQHENHHVRDNMDCLDDLENEFMSYPTSGQSHVQAA